MTTTKKAMLHEIRGLCLNVIRRLSETPPQPQYTPWIGCTVLCDGIILSNGSSRAQETDIDFDIPERVEVRYITADGPCLIEKVTLGVMLVHEGCTRYAAIGRDAAPRTRLTVRIVRIAETWREP